MAYNKLSIEERLLAKAKWVGECLVWFGNKDSNGYGRIRYGGVANYPAHRLNYELLHGPIPDGLVLRHSCDNPACINVAHLDPGTQKQNIADKYERGRANHATGENHGRAKLTREQVDAIRQRYVPGKKGCGTHALAKEFGVAQSTLRAIVSGEHWK